MRTAAHIRTRAHCRMGKLEAAEGEEDEEKRKKEKKKKKKKKDKKDKQASMLTFTQDDDEENE